METQTELQSLYTMDEEFREWVRTMLRQGILQVTFQKKDGSLREMTCTLQSGFIPEENVPTGAGKAKNDEAIAVYDLEVEGWRSFRWDSVKNILFSLDFE